jgi:tagaturonate reductase
MLTRNPQEPRPPIRVLQIGDGVFLRGFVDWMIDVANEKVGAGLGVAVALARPHPRPPALAAQDGLFTVLERGRAEGEVVDRRRVVRCLQLAFDPHAEPQTLRRLAASHDLSFVISNTTEAGIVDSEEPYDPAGCPLNFPAKIAWLLKARFDALGGVAAPGLVVLPCELIEGNGATLRRLTLAAAQRWNFAPEFVDWVGDSCPFLDTLVDRIVPGFPAAEAERLFEAWGYRDPLAIAAEPYHLWVIEGDLDQRLPLARAGLNVVWTDDVKPYRDAKLRMLNGAHTALAFPALLAGLHTVGEAVADLQFSAYLNQVLFGEIVPHVPLPPQAREAYARSVLERFANPFLRHELIAITLNSVAKWRARLLPTVKAAGETPLIAFGFAALVRFYRGPVRDEPEALAALARAWDGAIDAGEATHRALGDARLWGEDLCALSGFATQARESAADIEALGVRGALARRRGL